MEKDSQATKEKDYKKYIVTTVVYAGSFLEAVQEARFGKVINIGLSNDESLDNV